MCGYLRVSVIFLENLIKRVGNFVLIYYNNINMGWCAEYNPTFYKEKHNE